MSYRDNDVPVVLSELLRAFDFAKKAGNDKTMAALKRIYESGQYFNDVDQVKVGLNTPPKIKSKYVSSSEMQTMLNKQVPKTVSDITKEPIKETKIEIPVIPPVTQSKSDSLTVNEDLFKPSIE